MSDFKKFSNLRHSLKNKLLSFSFQFQLLVPIRALRWLTPKARSIPINPVCSLQVSHVTRIPSHKTKLPSKVHVSFVPRRLSVPCQLDNLVVIQKGIQTTHCYKAAGEYSTM